MRNLFRRVEMINWKRRVDTMTPSEIRTDIENILISLKKLWESNSDFMYKSSRDDELTERLIELEEYHSKSLEYTLDKIFVKTMNDELTCSW